MQVHVNKTHTKQLMRNLGGVTLTPGFGPKYNTSLVCTIPRQLEHGFPRPGSEWTFSGQPKERGSTNRPLRQA